MDCFKIKLLLRNSYHSHTQEYSSSVFEHLFICRSCWAYANYLWHREAQEVGRKHQIADSDHEARLEAVWAGRHQGRTLGQLGGLPAALKFGTVSSERKLSH